MGPFGRKIPAKIERRRTSRVRALEAGGAEEEVGSVADRYDGCLLSRRRMGDFQVDRLDGKGWGWRSAREVIGRYGD